MSSVYVSAYELLLNCFPIFLCPSISLQRAFPVAATRLDEDRPREIAGCLTDCERITRQTHICLYLCYTIDYLHWNFVIFGEFIQIFCWTCVSIFNRLLYNIHIMYIIYHTSKPILFIYLYRIKIEMNCHVKIHFIHSKSLKHTKYQKINSKKFL